MGFGLGDLQFSFHTTHHAKCSDLYTYMHTYMQVFIHNITDIHTYIHTYMHTGSCVLVEITMSSNYSILVILQTLVLKEHILLYKQVQSLWRSPLYPYLSLHMQLCNTKEAKTTQILIRCCRSRAVLVNSSQSTFSMPDINSVHF